MPAPTGPVPTGPAHRDADPTYPSSQPPCEQPDTSGATSDGQPARLADPAAVPPQMPQLLQAWLPMQRWFSGKGRDMRVESAYPLSRLGDHPFPSEIWLVRVRYSDGRAETYQVPLVRRTNRSDGLTHVLVGETVDPVTGEPWWWYDALHDKEVTDVWLRRMEADDSTERLSFQRGPGVTQLPTGAPSLALTAEQSNTSLVYGEAAILKVFRRVAHGLNPDIEVHEALARTGGDRHVARLLGHVSGRWSDPGVDGGAVDEGSLAMLQEFFRTASDGWELAKTSVRDLYAEADLHADEVGGDFAGEARRLGLATAELHSDLARALPTGSLDAEEVAALAQAMRDRLDAALQVVPELAEFSSALRATYDALQAQHASLPVQRIHGDYHLGQVLRTVRRWVVLDFEGEPAKPLAERVRPDSPIRDVAGMLRSFDYAARHLLTDYSHQPQLAYRAEEWAGRNSSAFCDGYAESGGVDPREHGALLRAYEADKAVYEAVYEARNRPSWLPIPLGSLARLTQGVAG